MPVPGSSEVRDFSELGELSRDHLTLFICGPGFGEMVVAALPGCGWIVVDGAAANDEFSARAVLDRFRREDEPVDALLLTHPHADHYAGFVELLDDRRHGNAIRKIGCVAAYMSTPATHTRAFRQDHPGAPGVAAYMSTPATHTFDLELSSRQSRVAAARDPLEAVRSGRTRSVLERIRTEWDDDSSRRLSLTANLQLSLTSSRATVRVLSPTTHDIVTFFAASGLDQRVASRSNDLSAVLELRFGDCRILLGGDLPDARDGHAVSSGWTAVASRETDLRIHHGLKIPHHGSREALPDCLIDPLPGGVTTARTWVATPFNRGLGLPLFRPEHGVDAMLDREDELLLTGLPMGWSQQLPLPPKLARADLRERVVDVPGLRASERHGPLFGTPTSGCRTACGP